MINGYVKTHREIWDHWTWEDKPFSKGQAWLDLIMLVNYKDGKIPYKHQMTPIKRGQTIRSERDLSFRWGWSKSKVHDFLTLLKNDEMILIDNNNVNNDDNEELWRDNEGEPKHPSNKNLKANRITICNYDKYQGNGTDEEPIKDQLKTDQQPIKDLNKKDKNEKNNNIPFQGILNLYHEILPELPKVAKLTPKRKSQIRSRWMESEKTQNLDWWKQYFQKVRTKPFYLGINDRGWRADIEYLTRQEPFVKIVEGN